MGLTIEERRELIAEDNGDPNGIVSVVRGNGAKTYHTADCVSLDQASGSAREITRAAAQKSNRYAPCRRCILTDQDDCSGNNPPKPETRYADLIAAPSTSEDS